MSLVMLREELVEILGGNQLQDRVPQELQTLVRPSVNGRHRDYKVGLAIRSFV